MLIDLRKPLSPRKRKTKNTEDVYQLDKFTAWTTTRLHIRSTTLYIFLFDLFLFTANNDFES